MCEASRRSAVRRWAWRLCVLAGVLLIPGAAPAQDAGNPLRLLRPWIEQQLFGRETSRPADAPQSTGEEPGSPDDRDEAAADGFSAGASAPGEGAAAAPGEEGAISLPQGALSDDTVTGTTAAPDSMTDVLRNNAEARQPVLRFGLIAGRSPSRTLAAVAPMASALRVALGRRVEFLPLTTYGALIDAQVQRRIDGGFFSTAAFADADSLCSCLEPLVAPRALDGTLAYHAIVVAREGSGIEQPGDLAGKTVAVGPADSIGGRRMQLAGLMIDGIDPATAFGSVIEADSSEEAVALVLAGRADAAFAWSSLSGDAATGYSRGVLADLVRGGLSAAGSLAIVWRSPPVGHGPFAVASSLSDDDKAKLRDYMLALFDGNPEAYDALEPLYGGGFASVGADDYAGIEALFQQDVGAISLPISRHASAVPADAKAPLEADVLQPN